MTENAIYQKILDKVEAYHELHEYPLIDFTYKNCVTQEQNVIKWRNVSDYRASDIGSHLTDDALARIRVYTHAENKSEAVMSIFRIIFICAILIISALYISKDA